MLLYKKNTAIYDNMEKYNTTTSDNREKLNARWDLTINYLEQIGEAI